jgi:hypothetical protein
MHSSRHFCSFLTKICVFPKDLYKSPKYEVSLKSAQWELRWYVRTDRQTDRETTDGNYETNRLNSLICNCTENMQ